MLFYLGVWTVIGRYYGLQHDAQVYVVQALAILRPEIYAEDLFLRFGSQDDFTVFSNLTAPWIGTLGVDHGPAALTFVSLLCWFLSAWFLLRQLTDKRIAWLGVGLLLAIPGWYGAGNVFEISERFLSARLPAEALCLLAIAFTTRRSIVLACLALVSALAVHPLMAVPAVITVALTELFPRLQARSAAAATLALAALCLVAGWLLGGTEPLLNGDWLRAVRSRSNYLFLDTWTSNDWQNTFVTLATMLVAARVATSDATKRLLLSATCAALAGLLAACAVSFLVPVTVVLQGQPWRWIWIGTFLAIGLLPWLLPALWSTSAATRAAGLLLASAWLINGLNGTGSALADARGMLAFSALALVMLTSRLSPRHALLTLYGAWGLLLVSLASAASTLVLEASLDFDFGGDPVWIQRVGGILMTPSLAAISVVAAWTALTRQPTLAKTLAVGVLGAIISIGAAPKAWARWTGEDYGDETRSAFAEWRSRIGPDQEVLWPDGLQTTWFVLERRSYLTLSQLGGIVFSRRTAEEALKRADALASVYPPGAWFNEPSSAQPTERRLSISDLQSICRAPKLSFLVSNEDLGLGAPRVEWPTKGMHVYLYDCGLVVTAGE